MGICICGSPRPGEHCDECDVTHPVPVVTYAEAEARLTDEVVMAVFELLDWDTRAGSCGQARQTVLSALFPEGGQG